MVLIFNLLNYSMNIQWPDKKGVQRRDKIYLEPNGLAKCRHLYVLSYCIKWPFINETQEASEFLCLMDDESDCNHSNVSAMLRSAACKQVKKNINIMISLLFIINKITIINFHEQATRLRSQAKRRTFHFYFIFHVLLCYQSHNFKVWLCLSKWVYFIIQNHWNNSIKREKLPFPWLALWESSETWLQCKRESRCSMN